MKLHILEGIVRKTTKAFLVSQGTFTELPDPLHVAYLDRMIELYFRVVGCPKELLFPLHKLSVKQFLLVIHNKNTPIILVNYAISIIASKR
jgi:hypothetical protein